VQEIIVEPAWRSDAGIHGDVEAALLMDPAADSYEIDASVDEGSVTLEGRVDSWQEKQVAADVVSGVRGVREVNNQLAVDFDLNRSDSEIAADVRKRLDWDVRLGDGLIDAEVQDGRVELTGWVGSAAELTLARSSAWVAGTREVDTSGLDVRWWADDGTRSADYSVRTDADIEQAVRDAFLYDPRVLSFEPEVRVENGEVTLSGIVDNAEARRAAEMDARNTVGVWRVRNHIKVRPTETPADADLVQSVRKAIARDPYLERHPITVLADAGHITLEGRVDYDYEKQRADRVARRMAGVSSVGNELRVDHNWTWRSDFEIRRSIEDELYWSPFVDSDAVSVTVENGVATLQGTVDDWSEAIHAIDNARDGGARRVRSRLEIATIDSLS
jgi:osmotically-inducible protein OsmY